MSAFRSERDESLLADVKARSSGKSGPLTAEEKSHLRGLAREVDDLPFDESGPADFAPALCGYLDDHYYPEFGCRHGSPHTDHRPGCSTRVPAVWEHVIELVVRSEKHYRIDRDWYDRRRAWLRERKP